MDRLTIIFSAILLITSLLAEVAEAEGHNSEQLSNAYAKRKMPMWFGPRLGRRKRNPHEEDNYITPALERDQLEALMAILAAANGKLPSSPADLQVRVPEVKRPGFTPRLGRESGEDLVSSGSPNMGNRWLQDSELAGELMSQRSPPFAPRLGRRLYPFSPRLGRENDRS